MLALDFLNDITTNRYTNRVPESLRFVFNDLGVIAEHNAELPKSTSKILNIAHACHGWIIRRRQLRNIPFSLRDAGITEACLMILEASAKKLNLEDLPDLESAKPLRETATSLQQYYQAAQEALPTWPPGGQFIKVWKHIQSIEGLKPERIIDDTECERSSAMTHHMASMFHGKKAENPYLADAITAARQVVTYRGEDTAAHRLIANDLLELNNAAIVAQAIFALPLSDRLQKMTIVTSDQILDFIASNKRAQKIG